jgi:hypothetical protein
MRLSRAWYVRHRSGVSPVVAELTLIAVVLISAVALSGFLYGVLTMYTSPAEVAAQVTVCTTSGDSEVCQFILSNLGSHPIDTDGACTMSIRGSMVPGTIQNGGEVPANGSLEGVACVVSGATALSGSRVAGTVGLLGGAVTYYTGTST